MGVSFTLFGLEAAWFILLLPIVAAIAIALGTLRSRKMSAAISCSAILIGLVLTLIYLFKIVAHGHAPEPTVSGSLTTPRN